MLTISSNLRHETASGCGKHIVTTQFPCQSCLCLWITFGRSSWRVITCAVHLRLGYRYCNKKAFSMHITWDTSSRARSDISSISFCYSATQLLPQTHVLNLPTYHLPWCMCSWVGNVRSKSVVSVVNMSVQARQI
jgi:hypothetical protein